MTYQKVCQSHLDYFISLLGAPYVLFDQEHLLKYGSDETEDLSFPPEVVLKPKNTQEVSDIMRYCFQENIPVTPIGARTGLSGGCLSLYGGVGLSIERMNQVVYLDEKNLQITVQPGIITEVLQNTVREKGLYYPPDPSSKGSCFIGGNIAENAGGPRAVKYGVTKDYVLNLEVVLPNGDVIWTGANTLKNSTGYNLTQLMVGSEGTLGVITQIVLRLIPAPTHNLLILAPFNSAQKACEAVSAIFRAGITPSALEFMERDAIDWVLAYRPEINIKVPNDVQAHLLIEVDGHYLETLYQDIEKINAVLEQFDVGEVLLADSEAQKNTLWEMRRKVAESVKANSVYKEEDTVVPRFELPKLLAKIKDIGATYGFQSVCYGHAGDGNLHVNIIKGDLSEEAWNKQVTKGIEEIFEYTVALGGTLSGEHGIGLVQKPYMPIAFSQIALELQRNIKKTFDPKGILNPGKMF